uniref:UDENN domain-containing protein n=1 Tax=Macrostomum lignano TaxID=282301 RepID=A0A1I8J4X2_9PLAT
MSGFYLKNRLLEVLVVVGADDSSSLRPRPGGGAGSGPNKLLTSIAYEPCFLATVNESKAVFPNNHPPVAPFYPLPAFHAGSRASRSLAQGRLVEQQHQQPPAQTPTMIEEEDEEEEDSEAPPYLASLGVGGGSSSGGGGGGGRGGRRLGIVQSLLPSSSPRQSISAASSRQARRPSFARANADVVKSLMSDEDQQQQTLARLMRRRPTLTGSSVGGGGIGGGLSGVGGADGRRMSSVRNIAVTKHEKKVAGEVAEGLPDLCYPEGLQISARPLEARIDYHVLTHISGDRLYATLLTFGRQYRARRQPSLANAGPNSDEDAEEDADDDSLVQLRLEEDCRDDDVDGLNDEIVYVPSTVILVSKLPYFSVLKTSLSAILSRVSQEDPHNFNSIIMSATIALCSTPVPPPSDTCLGIQSELFGVTLNLLPPMPRIGLVVDFDVTVLFRSLPLDDILLLLSALLTDQRIVVTSSDASLIALVMESLLLLLYPMRWNLPYMSNIPSVEFLGAPQPFFFGCHSNCRDEVNETAGLVVGDLDSGKVYLTEPAELVPSMPRDVLRRLKDQLSPRLKKLNFDWVILSKPDALSIEDFNKQKTQFNMENRHLLLNTFLQLMVELFGAVTQFIKEEARFFNKDGYLNSLPNADRSFYEMVVNGTMFDAFLHDRLDNREDAWDRQARSNRKQSYAQTKKRQSTALMSMPRVPELEPSQRNPDYLQLPEYFPKEAGGDGFYQRCIDMLGRQLDGAERSRRVAIHYLRSMYHLATGQNVPALRDCHECYRLDSRLVNQPAVREIMRGLSDAERQALKEELDQLRQFVHSASGGNFDLDAEDSFEQPASIMTAAVAAAAAAAAVAGGDVVDTIDSGDEALKDRRRISRQIQLPTRCISKTSFGECLANLGISFDEELQRRLFNTLLLLSLDQSAVTGTAANVDINIEDEDGDQLLMPEEKFGVDPGVFDAFYEMWSSRVRGLLDVDAPEDGAIVLKAGSLVHVEKLGAGHLILTDKRLYLRSPQGHSGSPFVCLANLDQVSKVERPTRMLWRLASGYASLRITVESSMPAGPAESKSLDRHQSAHQHNSSHTIWLKGDLPAWYTVLEEYLAAVRAYRIAKDRTILHKACENALIIDTLLALASVEGSQFHRADKQLMDCFLYFSKGRYDCSLPASTYDSLVSKFNPAFGESEKVTIVGLFPMSNAAQYSYPEPIYCAFNTSTMSKLAIVDVEAGQIDCVVASPPGRIHCAMQVSSEPSHFWLATYHHQSGSQLTVICTAHRTHSTEERLIGHRHPVLSMVEVNDHCYSISSGFSIADKQPAEILVWHTAQRKLLRRVDCGPGVRPVCLSPITAAHQCAGGCDMSEVVKPLLLFCSRRAIFSLNASHKPQLLVSLESGGHFECDRLLALTTQDHRLVLVAASDRVGELRFYPTELGPSNKPALTVREPASRLKLQCPSRLAAVEALARCAS